MKVYSTREHKSFSGEEAAGIKALHLDFACEKNTVKYLGLNPNLYCSYYIGVDWLKENEAAIQVNPKVEQVDFMQMFSACLNTPCSGSELRKIYHIDMDSPSIETDNLPCDMTPMLMVHFLSVLKNIAGRGLKKDYIREEENLQSKVKGKLKFSNHFKRNLASGNYHRNYCNFQSYSVDCLENKLLKKTLLFVGAYLTRHQINASTQTAWNYCMAAFEIVSADVDAIQIKRVRINPVYKDYAEALRLAKLILKRFAYSIAETNRDKKKATPPFWINMALLFELYVFGKLREAYGSQIGYQVKGKYGWVDFIKLNEKIVIDTKYKMIYNDCKYDIANIRQVSAYARDINIRKKLKAADNELLTCCIIYPDLDKKEDFKKESLLEEKIDQFEHFWKVGIKLPMST